MSDLQDQNTAEITRTLAASAVALQPVDQPLPLQIGEYRILRILGQGGMGTVYEAEHIEDSRIVALKVMNQMLPTAKERDRFIREGRLAAAVSHPNCVFVYSVSEINGQPVIAMERVNGGTLRDWVQTNGPMPAERAVAVALEITSGLEAALQAGILHRDVKPGNCFLDSNGSVKVGDFGLSRPSSRLVVESTDTGSFQGTPAYASPEQIEGKDLDARSDIYAVGATLYYLLTGKTPFAERDMIQLVAAILTRTPDAPSKIDPKIPLSLSSLVMKCLAKNRDSRFAGYSQLREALLRLTPELEAPPLALRFAAGFIDYAATGVLNWLILTLLSLVNPNVRAADLGQILVIPWIIGAGLLMPIGWGLAEGKWGFTLGKAICGLRVHGSGHRPPGALRGILRSLMFYLFSQGASLLIYFVGDSFLRLAIFLTSYLVPWVTVRRRNGWAGLHDLAVGARVVRVRTQHAARQAAFRPRPVHPGDSTGRKVGPYQVIHEVPGPWACQVSEAWDAKLKRHVWIAEYSEACPPLTVERKTVSRPARLHWIAGKRSAQENWDAFESPGGSALDDLPLPQPWRVVRHWLLDLAEELPHSGDVPDFSTSRVWIRADQRAVLIDLPMETDAGSPTTDPRSFLRCLAWHCLGTDAVLPAHANAVLSPTSDGHWDFHTFASALRAGNSRMAEITATRRFLPMAAGYSLFFLVSAMPYLSPQFRSGLVVGMEVFLLQHALEGKGDVKLTPEERRLVMGQMQERYAAILNQNPSRPGSIFGSRQGKRDLRTEILKATPLATSEEKRKASQLIDKITAEFRERISLKVVASGLMFIPIFFEFLGLVWVLLTGAFFAFRVSGIVLIRSGGMPAGRFLYAVRSALRVVVACFLFLAVRTESWIPTGIIVAVLTICIAWTAWRPNRGPLDHLMDTWVVPE